MDGLALAHHQVVHRRQQGGGVGVPVMQGALFGHLGGAGQQLVDVDAAHGGREQPHRAQHAEAPAHVVGHGQHVVAVGLGDLVQRALGQVGGGDDPPAEGLIPQPLTQELAEDHERRGGFSRLAALGNDVYQRGLEPPAEQSQHVVDQGGVNVVQHEEARAAPGRIGQQVVGGRPQGRVQGDVAQGRTADAQHHQVGRPRPVLVHQGHDPVAVVAPRGQFGVPQVPGFDLVHHAVMRRHQPRLKRLQLLVADAVRAYDLGRGVLPVHAYHPVFLSVWRIEQDRPAAGNRATKNRRARGFCRRQVPRAGGKSAKVRSAEVPKVAQVCNLCKVRKSGSSPRRKSGVPCFFQSATNNANDANKGRDANKTKKKRFFLTSFLATSLSLRSIPIFLAPTSRVPPCKQW